MTYIHHVPEIDSYILSFLSDVELFQLIYFLNRYYYNLINNSSNYSYAKKILSSTKERSFSYICSVGLINIAKCFESNP